MDPATIIPTAWKVVRILIDRIRRREQAIGMEKKAVERDLKTIQDNAITLHNQLCRVYVPLMSPRRLTKTEISAIRLERTHVTETPLKAVCEASHKLLQAVSAKHSFLSEIEKGQVSSDVSRYIEQWVGEVSDLHKDLMGCLGRAWP